MITESDVEDIMTALVEFDDRLKQVEARLDGIEGAILIHDEAFLRVERYDKDQVVRYGQFEGITARLADLTGLTKAEVLWESRIGDRMTRIESQLADHTRLHTQVLEEIGLSLIEVKGQISDPFRKEQAIDRLAIRVKELRRN